MYMFAAGYWLTNMYRCAFVVSKLTHYAIPDVYNTEAKHGEHTIMGISLFLKVHSPILPPYHRIPIYFRDVCRFYYSCMMVVHQLVR